MSLLANDEAATLALKKKTDKEIVVSPSLVSRTDEVGEDEERNHRHKRSFCYSAKNISEMSRAE